MKHQSPVLRLAVAVLLSAVLCCVSSLQAAEKKEKFDVAWSHYVGWEPWGYAQQSGILKKWADKYNIEIKLTLVNDYIESINLYTSGKFDACTMANMDALTIPAVGGVDSTALIVGDFSNGNDGIIMKKGAKVTDLKGRKITLVELSVSHYLLARALDMNGMSEQDVNLINTSDADIAALFTADPKGAAVTWNPPLMQALRAPEAVRVFDSSSIPGEIIDLMVVRTDAPEALKKALVGAWYEVMAIMATDGPKKEEAIAAMAQISGGTVDEFKQQLATTAMFYKAEDAAAFAASAKPKETMEQVRQFSYDKGLYGESAPSPDIVGISFDDGSVLGDKNNIKLRFTAKYMQ
ncbi:MAG: putative urea ABC transporter substrate-binding protein [Candidatus Electrothrix sp. GW3-4]|uniref:putative urea ABC transporter substrate-binding protein n=1 Tax=Candidatus Electrothrix sp. GW3-4 TaxID=3126740 RepID=UPI0030CAD0AD